MGLEGVDGVVYGCVDHVHDVVFGSGFDFEGCEFLKAWAHILEVFVPVGIKQPGCDGDVGGVVVDVRGEFPG